MQHVRRAMQFAFTGVALVIGFLAASFTAAQKPENEAYAVISDALLACGVVALGLTVVGTVLFYLADVWQERRKQEIRRRLAIFTQDGQQVISTCHERSRTNGEAPDEEAQAWSEEVFTYLRDTRGLGVDFAVRFDTPQGLPLGTTTLSQPYSRVEGSVRARVARLAEIMQALGDASL